LSRIKLWRPVRRYGFAIRAMEDDMTDAPEQKTEKTEKIEVSGDRLIEKVKAIAREGKARRLRVKEPDGDIAVDVPLAVGAIAGGAVVLAAPVLAVIGAIAALASHVTIEIITEADEAKPQDTPAA
jgi:hypothetical protein